MTLVSGINFLNQAFHLATHALAGFPKLHHKCSAHSEFRIWLVSASARGYSVEFTWILCRRWKTDAVARTVNGSGESRALVRWSSRGAAQEIGPRCIGIEVRGNHQFSPLLSPVESTRLPSDGFINRNGEVRTG